MENQITTNTALSNAQLEILKLFSRPLNAKDLSDLHQTLQDFLAKKIDEEVDRVWDEKQMNADTIEDLLLYK